MKKYNTPVISVSKFYTESVLTTATLPSAGWATYDANKTDADFTKEVSYNGLSWSF